MSGGTLTPPRDPTWDSDELIAPVIPFRQRGEQPQQPTLVDRTPDAPILVAPPDRPPSSWIHQGNELQPPTDAATRPGDDAHLSRSRRPRRLLIAGVIAATLAVGIAAALALRHAPQPRAQLSDQHAALSSRTGRAGSSSRTHPAKTAARKPASRVKTTARKPASRVKASDRKTAHHATASNRKHATVRPAALHVSQPSTPASVVHATTPSVQPTKTSAPASNPCADSVPGQLGC
jgi:cytoskeletal protein RodZ